MASNEIPREYEPLVELLHDATDGATTHGAAIGVKANDGPTLQATLDSLVGIPAGPNNVPPAIPGLKALWNTAKANKSATTAALRAAISNGRALAMACVGTLKPRLGNSWTAAWQAAGFQGGSLETPKNPQARLLELRAYYADHPTHEVPDLSPTISATAAACQAAADAIGAADTTSNQSNADAGQAKAALEAGIKAARSHLGGLREELSRLLGDDDERWYLFGFERPSDPETPETPANLVATPGAPGSHSVFVDWDNARRAETYRVLARDATTGAQVLAKLVGESEAMLAGLPPGATLKIAVTARNDAGGESAESDPITVAVP
jgi:hypothetical protein